MENKIENWYGNVLESLDKPTQEKISYLMDGVMIGLGEKIDREKLNKISPIEYNGNTVFLKYFPDRVLAYLIKKQLFQKNDEATKLAITKFYDDTCQEKIGETIYYSTGYKDKSKGRSHRIDEAIKLRDEIQNKFPNVKTKIIESLTGNWNSDITNEKKIKDKLIGQGYRDKEAEIIILKGKDFMVFTSPVLEENQYRSLKSFSSGGVVYGGHLNSFEQLANKY